MLRKKEKPQQKNKHPSAEALAKFLDVPQNSFHEFSQIVLSGNYEAVLDGCQGVIEYEDSYIKLNIGGKLVKFTGSKLQIRCMTGENVILDGEIQSIEFL